MNLRRFGLVLLSCLLIPACAQIATIGGDLDAYLDRLIRNQEYATAMDVLDNSHQVDDSPSLKAKQAQVLALIADYEKTFSQQTNALLRQGKWSELETLIEQAEHSIHGSAYIKKAKQRLVAKKNAARQELEFKRAIAEGKWLLQSLSLDESIYEVSPYDSAVKSRLRYGKFRARELTEILSDLGVAASEQEQFGRAQQAFALASSLLPVLNDDPASRKISERVALEKQRLETKQATQTERRFVKLLDAIKAAQDSPDLEKRLALVRQAEKLNRDDPRLATLRGPLDQEVDQAIADYQEQGNTKYSQGKYAQAIADWQRVLALDPNNELAMSNIARAERVLGNLEKLRQKQTTD